VYANPTIDSLSLAGSLICAKDLGVFKSGNNKKQFVEAERERAFKTWAG
jgi:hypothetical protein